jgi:hypothetical protein
MTGLLRKAVLFAGAGVLVASSVMAAVPSPTDSDVPCQINLVGTTGGVADSRGQLTMTIRDLAHNPIAGSSVVIDFDACTPDIRVCSVQPFAGVTADCSTTVGEVNAVTDGSGVVTLRIVGGANNAASGTPAAGFRCATVYADGVSMGTTNIGAFDENGAGGVNPADVSTWLSDSFDGDYEGRSDFNNACSNVSGVINPADLSLLLGVSLGGGSFTSCGAYCH